MTLQVVEDCPQLLVDSTASEIVVEPSMTVQKIGEAEPKNSESLLKDQLKRVLSAEAYGELADSIRLEINCPCPVNVFYVFIFKVMKSVNSSFAANMRWSVCRWVLEKKRASSEDCVPPRGRRLKWTVGLVEFHKRKTLAAHQQDIAGFFNVPSNCVKLEGVMDEMEAEGKATYVSKFEEGQSKTVFTFGSVPEFYLSAFPLNVVRASLMDLDIRKISQ